MSLIELIVVMGVVVLTLGLLVPSVGSIGKANALTVAGNSVSSLLGLARQNSLSKNAYTAFVMNADPESDGYLRAFSVWQLLASPDGSGPTTWQQVSKWETLKEGVLVDVPQAADWLVAAPTPPFSNMKYGGAGMDRVFYQIFLPSGSIWGGASGSIKLVEGHVIDGSVEYTRPDGGVAANTYEITIVPSTGRAKIARN